jgi:DNA-binding beta-propeller fold protein YncE
MLALIYLATAVYLGERLCRRFYHFVSPPQRWAAGALVGLLLSSWFTYLAARVFAAAKTPLLWGNILFFVAAGAALFWLHRRPTENARWIEPRAEGSDWWDWLTLGMYFLLASWMMFATLGFKDGKLLIGNNEWSDFGPNTAIAQSFAVGHNFPTQYPHFAGEPIRYHFLFYFQAGNLEFLGLNLAWSLNILSILSLVCMLALVMALGELLFNSRMVGRIGSALFFFHGSLSFIPFLRSQSSVAGAIRAIFNLREFLPSGYPYRGELWGIWTQIVFINQRHLASSIGILLVVLIFLIYQYRQRLLERRIEPALSANNLALGSPPLDSAAVDEVQSESGGEIEPALSANNLAVGSPPFDSAAVDEAQSDNGREIEVALTAGDQPMLQPPDSAPVGEAPSHGDSAIKDFRDPISKVIMVIRDNVVSSMSFIFSGLLLGALPFWNAPVFTSAFAVLLFLFLLFPYRRHMVALGLTAAVVALPQILYLRSGDVRPTTHSLFHWGYVIDNPTIGKVIKYLAFSFGVKWLLIILALIFLSWFHRRLFIAISSLFLLTFCFQFSDELLANHKFLNIWLILANLFVAYGLWQLWQLKGRGRVITGQQAAIVLSIFIVIGGIIDLFPVHNSFYMEMAYSNDRLVNWTLSETKPDATFLTDRYVNHPILLAGRRIFYGWPYFTWGAGYDTDAREKIYRQMFESQDPQQVFRLLKENGISYVAFDNGVRRGGFIKGANEQLYTDNFPKVFEDKENRYDSLTIYKVAEAIGHFPSPSQGSPAVAHAESPGLSMFEGGKGTGNGQFDWPRGLAVDGAGNVLVSDANNGRIQKFSSAGVFLASIGRSGSGEGEFRAPNGIAVDKSGNIYVADVLNQRVQKIKPDATFIAQWNGPEPGFVGPGDIAMGPDNSIYVVDQGNARIVKFGSGWRVLAVWGTRGAGDGQFNEATSVAVDEKTNRVYVADPRNRRIEVFDTNGKFVANWFVEEWQPKENLWYFQDLVVDSKAGRLYASSTATDEVLVFDLNGKKIGSLKPNPPDKLEGASSLALTNGRLYVLNTFSARVSRIDLETK